MRDANSRVQVSLAYYQNRTEVGLVVRDDSSGYGIVEVELTAEDFRRLLSSQLLVLDGWTIQRPYRDRLGMRREHKVKRVQGTMTQGVSGGPTEEMVSWARGEARAGEWDEWEWRRHNYGWALHLERYVPQVEVGADG